VGAFFLVASHWHADKPEEKVMAPQVRVTFGRPSLPTPITGPRLGPAPPPPSPSASPKPAAVQPKPAAPKPPVLAAVAPLDAKPAAKPAPKPAPTPTVAAPPDPAPPPPAEPAPIAEVPAAASPPDEPAEPSSSTNPLGSAGAAAPPGAGNGRRSAPVLSAAEREDYLQRYLRDILRTRIAARFHYPEEAEALGIEGLVVVRISVLPSGAVSLTRVVGVCPHRLLCEAAERTIREAAPYPPPPRELGGAISVSVPFDYRLE
jgi:protein TonB